jgi:hypothetical protein
MINPFSFRLPEPQGNRLILMDTTYFGRNFGVMLLKDTQGYNLYVRFVKYETITLYIEAINHLKTQGIQIRAIVCDGRKGLISALGEYPIQSANSIKLQR